MNSKDVSALMAASAEDRAAAFEEGRRAGLEEAARVADSYNRDPYPQTEYDRGWARGAECITNGIRALAKTSTPQEGEE